MLFDLIRLKLPNEVQNANECLSLQFYIVRLERGVLKPQAKMLERITLLLLMMQNTYPEGDVPAFLAWKSEDVCASS